jgi:DNA primase
MPILVVAETLGLEVAGRKARCFNGRAHHSGVDANPSLVLFPDYGRFKCFVCGVRGDTIDLVKGVLGLSFRDAVAWIDRLAGGAAPAGPAGGSPCSRPAEQDGQAAEVYQALYQLASPPAPGSSAGAYLLGRGIDPGLAADLGAREVNHLPTLWHHLREWFGEEQLRAAGLLNRRDDFLFSHHRLLFFYLDGDRAAFVQGRDVTGAAAAKELGPARLACPIPFNRNVLFQQPGRVYVCEGCIDTLSAVQLGYPAVGVPGVHAFREEWFALFRGVREVCLLFDNDEAGRRQGAELRARFRLHGFRADAYAPAFGKDVNDTLRALLKGGTA